MFFRIGICGPQNICVFLLGPPPPCKSHKNTKKLFRRQSSVKKILAQNTLSSGLLPILCQKNTGSKHTFEWPAANIQDPATWLGARA